MNHYVGANSLVVKAKASEPDSIEGKGKAVREGRQLPLSLTLALIPTTTFLPIMGMNSSFCSYKMLCICMHIYGE